MASRSSDFNYKVALASGLKSLQGGRLRQAEEQFRYLVQHFAGAEGGYRGLAKVLVEQEDRPGALRILLEGGAALAKADQRALAISLYREAVALAPTDLAAHRRLAAALTLTGDMDDAAREFARFIAAARNAGDGERARLEAAYALERIPGSAQLAEAARGAVAEAAAAAAASSTERERADAAATTPDERAAMMRSAFGMPAPEPVAARPVEPERSMWATPEATEATRPPTPAPAPARADPWATPEPDAPQAIDATADAESVEAIAVQYLASGDPRGAPHALEAARRYIAHGHTDAASDLLLHLIASGIATHEAQRLLVDVARTLGKKDVAKAKIELLVEALKLDGRMDLAAEVEQQAQAS